MTQLYAKWRHETEQPRLPDVLHVFIDVIFRFLSTNCTNYTFATYSEIRLSFVSLFTMFFLILLTARSCLACPKQVLFAFQIVLLGDANVGKSSIVTRFINGEFDPEIKNTVGAAFVTRTVETDGEKVKFQVWDTAGQGRVRLQESRLSVHLYLLTSLP